MRIRSLLLAVPITATFISFTSSTSEAAHHPIKHASKSAGLTVKQKDSLEAALKSLRRLGAATEVGVSQTDYQSRLIDTKADIDEDIRGIPATNPVVMHVSKAIEAYQDAATVWNDKMDYHYWSTLKDTALDSPMIVRKYHIVVDFESADSQAADRDELSEYAHGVITKGCWKVAHTEYEKAAANMN